MKKEPISCRSRKDLIEVTEPAEADSTIVQAVRKRFRMPGRLTANNEILKMELIIRRSLLELISCRGGKLMVQVTTTAATTTLLLLLATAAAAADDYYYATPLVTLPIRVPQ